ASGLKATFQTKPPWTLNVRNGVYVFASQSTFQIFTAGSSAAWSRADDAMNWPSGLTSTVALGLELCRISKSIFSPATSQTLTAGSEAPAETRRRPSGLKAKPGTPAGVRWKGWTSFPVAGAWKAIPLARPMARSWPSGLKPMLDIRWGQGMVRSSARESPSSPGEPVFKTGLLRAQSLTVLSQLAEARVRLSGEKATATALPRWPRRVYRKVNVVGRICNPSGELGTGCQSVLPVSQTFTVWSKLAEASQRPSRLKATPETCCWCAVRVTQCPAWGSGVSGVASQMRTV